MKIKPITKQAISRFLEKIINHAYDGTIKGLFRILRSGPPGRKKQPELIQLHEWYINLDERSQSIAISLVSEAVKRAIFSVLTVIDNKTVGLPIEGQISDFVLYLQTYENNEAMYNNIAQTSTRINLSYTAGGELHDAFLNLLQEREGVDV